MPQIYHWAIRFDFSAQVKCSRSRSPSPFQLQPQRRWSGQFACWSEQGVLSLPGWLTVRMRIRKEGFRWMQMLHVVAWRVQLSLLAAGNNETTNCYYYRVFKKMLCKSKNSWWRWKALFNLVFSPFFVCICTLIPLFFIWGLGTEMHNE